jgi:hypothetical protein
VIARKYNFVQSQIKKWGERLVTVDVSDTKKNCSKCLGCNQMEQKPFTSLQICDNYIEDRTNKERIFGNVTIKEGIKNICGKDSPNKVKFIWDMEKAYQR